MLISYSRGTSVQSPFINKHDAVVKAQLVEGSLQIPEVCCSNPVISKIYIEHLFAVKCIEKTKINLKEAGKGPFFRKRRKLKLTEYDKT